jgi:hypothetical protein
MLSPALQEVKAFFGGNAGIRETVRPSGDGAHGRRLQSEFGVPGRGQFCLLRVGEVFRYRAEARLGWPVLGRTMVSAVYRAAFAPA